MKEIWKVFIINNNKFTYEFSNLGNVRKLKNNGKYLMLKPLKQNNKYKLVFNTYNQQFSKKNIKELWLSCKEK